MTLVIESLAGALEHTEPQGGRPWDYSAFSYPACGATYR